MNTHDFADYTIDGPTATDATGQVGGATRRPVRWFPGLASKSGIRLKPPKPTARPMRRPPSRNR